MALVVRSSTGQVKSVISGGRQVAYGSVAYKKLPDSVKRDVEAKRSGKATIIQGKGGTSVYEGTPGQTAEQPIARSETAIVPKESTVTSVQRTPGGYQLVLAEKAPKNVVLVRPVGRKEGGIYNPQTGTQLGRFEQTQRAMGQSPYRQERSVELPLWFWTGTHDFVSSQYLQPKMNYPEEGNRYYSKTQYKIEKFGTDLGEKLGSFHPFRFGGGKVEQKLNKISDWLEVKSLEGSNTLKTELNRPKGYKAENFLSPFAAYEGFTQEATFGTAATITRGLANPPKFAVGAAVGTVLLGTKGGRVEAWKQVKAQPVRTVGETIVFGEALKTVPKTFKLFPTPREAGIPRKIIAFFPERAKVQAKYDTSLPLFSIKRTAKVTNAEPVLDLGFAKVIREEYVKPVTTSSRVREYYYGKINKWTRDVMPKVKNEPNYLVRSATVELKKFDIGEGVTVELKQPIRQTQLFKEKLGGKAEQFDWTTYKEKKTFSPDKRFDWTQYTGKSKRVPKDVVFVDVSKNYKIVGEGFTILKSKKGQSSFNSQALSDLRRKWEGNEFSPFARLNPARMRATNPFSSLSGKLNPRDVPFVEPVEYVRGSVGITKNEMITKQRTNQRNDLSFKQSLKSDLALKTEQVPKLKMTQLAGIKSVQIQKSAKLAGLKSVQLQKTDLLQEAKTQQVTIQDTMMKNRLTRSPSVKLPEPPVVKVPFPDGGFGKKKRRGLFKSGFGTGKKKRRGLKASWTVLPDLLSVTQYEMGGKEAISPRLTLPVKKSFMSGVRGTSFAYRVPTLQQQRRRGRR